MALSAILIANDTFPFAEGKLEPLTSLRENVDDMTRVLGNLGSPPFTVTPSLNDEATDIEDKIAKALKDAKNNELVLVYYAGHGRFLRKDGSNDELLIATYSSHAEPDRRYRDLPYAVIERSLNQAQVGRALIVLDCWGEEGKSCAGPDSLVPCLFSSQECYALPYLEGKTGDGPAPDEMGDGIYVLTQCARKGGVTGKPGNREGGFTRQLLLALKATQSGDVITAHGLFRQLLNATKGSPQTPALIRRSGDGSDVVIANKSDYGERRRLEFPRWKPRSNETRGRLSSLLPSYLLDAGFRFLDWNAVFEDVIARQLGLVIGCHAMEFVNRLANLREVTDRNRREFPRLTEEILKHCEVTGEIWDGFHPIDVERLDFISDRFGLIVFDKVAYQIPQSSFQRPTTWQVQLNLRFVQRRDDFWRNAKKIVRREDQWTAYAKSLDSVFRKYPSYVAWENEVVRQVGDCKACIAIGAGACAIVPSLLNVEDREVTAIESNDAVRTKLAGRLSDKPKYVERATILKGHATTVLKRMESERRDAGESPEMFDACVMMDAQSMCESPVALLKSVYPVLKPGAVLSMSFPKKGAQVEPLMNSIQAYHLKKTPEEWPDLEKAWESGREFSLELAEEGEREIDKVMPAIDSAQFQLDGKPTSDKFDDTVVLVKARKVVSDPKSGGRDERQPAPPPEPEDRPLVKMFVSYARDDKEVVDKLLKQLEEQLRPAKRFRYDFWQDNRLLVGEDWHAGIQKALDECDFGLLLISPAFLASDYIAENELKRLIGEKKPVIPVLLKTIHFDYYDLKGLESKQLFGFDREGRLQPYSSCRKKPTFVEQLFRQIEARVEKQLGSDAS